jgi:hypothetical protein
MKNKSQSNNENKIRITLSWKTHLMQSDANSPDEILRQKQDAEMKWRKTARNKNKVAKCCTWEAATDLNPNFEWERQNPHCSSSAAEDETCSCHITIYSKTALWLFNN